MPGSTSNSPAPPGVDRHEFYDDEPSIPSSPYQPHRPPPAPGQQPGRSSSWDLPGTGGAAGSATNGHPARSSSYDLSNSNTTATATHALGSPTIARVTGTDRRDREREYHFHISQQQRRQQQQHLQAPEPRQTEYRLSHPPPLPPPAPHLPHQVVYGGFGGGERGRREYYANTIEKAYHASPSSGRIHRRESRRARERERWTESGRDSRRGLGPPDLGARGGGPPSEKSGSAGESAGGVTVHTEMRGGLGGSSSGTRREREREPRHTAQGGGKPKEVVVHVEKKDKRERKEKDKDKEHGDAKGKSAPVVTTRDNPLRELDSLKFTPKVTAGAHMKAFEKLVGQAYPGASDAGRWGLFVKTLDDPQGGSGDADAWGKGKGSTPASWLGELSKKGIKIGASIKGRSDTITFEFLKNLFIEKWGSKAEREELRAKKEKSKEVEKEKVEREREKEREREREKKYLNDRVELQSHTSDHDSLPPTTGATSSVTSTRKAKATLVIHHHERNIESERQLPEDVSTVGSGGVVLTVGGDSKSSRRREREKDRDRDKDKHKGKEKEKEKEKRKSKVYVVPDTNSRSPNSRSTTPAQAPPPPPPPPPLPPSPPPPSQETEEVQSAKAPTPPPPEPTPPPADNEVENWNGENDGEAEGKFEHGEGFTVSAESVTDNTNIASQEAQAGADPLPNPTPPPPPEPITNIDTTVTTEVFASTNSNPPSPIASVTISSSTQTTDTTPPVIPKLPPTRPRLLEGKIAAITGSSRGIGRAISLAFAREGAHIIAHYWGTITDPATDDITSLRNEILTIGQTCETVFGDIADPHTSENIVRKAVEVYGRLDIAVGNAGMWIGRGWWDVTPELLRRHVEVNLEGNWWFVQACARQMRGQFRKAVSGITDHDIDHYEFPSTQLQQQQQASIEIPDTSIILISASNATTPNSPMASHYAATNAGIISLMQSSAGALGRYGIRVNAILPGVVATRMVKEEVEDEEWRRRMQRKVPLLGRVGRPRDVAGPAVFLAGEGAKYVTGAQLVVDGGAAVGGASSGGGVGMGVGVGMGW